MGSRPDRLQRSNVDAQTGSDVLHSTNIPDIMGLFEEAQMSVTLKKLWYYVALYSICEMPIGWFRDALDQALAMVLGAIMLAIVVTACELISVLVASHGRTTKRDRAGP